MLCFPVVDFCCSHYVGGAGQRSAGHGDIDPLTYNSSPEAIEADIMSRTRAVIPVHNGGHPADMDAIMEIADIHGLWAIEDCAHTRGSQWRGKGVGLIGHLGKFSFQIGKTLTCVC